MSRPPEETAPTADARAILRYWLAVLRHEEASQVGLEARPVPPLGAPPRLDLTRPDRSGGYVDLPLVGPRGDLRPLLVREERDLELPLDATVAPLFHGWLYREYRRQWAESRGHGARADEMLLRLGFPVLRWRQRRRPYVAPLLHVPVADLRWLDADGERWEPPTWRERKAGNLPEPPVAARMRVAPWEAEDVEPALGLDVGVLRRVLRMEPERVADLVLAWEDAASEGPEDVLRALTEWLGGDPDDDEPIDGLARALVPWARHGKAEVGVGALLYDAAGGSPTGMLQDELRQLADEDPLASAPLRHYVLGEAPARRRGLHLGLRSPRPLTDDQRAATETALETPLTAVQGPPGTGKTHLILEMAAHALVAAARGDAFADRGAGAHTSLLVTSVNNRAVDNVVDALTTDQPPERLPFALRVGSRAVLSERTTRELDRVAQWLRLHDTPRVPREEARERFDAALAEVERALAPLIDRRGQANRLEELRTGLEDVDAKLAVLPDTAALADGEPPLKALRKLRRRVHALESATETLYDAIEEDPPDPAKLLRTRWAKRIASRVHAVAEHLEGFPWPAPDGGVPSTDGISPADALFARLERITALRSAVDAHLEARVAHATDAGWRAILLARRDGLIRDLRACEEAPARDGDDDDGPLRVEVAAAEHALFVAARDLREAWAVAERDRLLGLVGALRRAAGGEGDWKGVLRRHPERRLWAGLFPVVGGTLLSLSHVLPLEPDVVHTLVVDEAGQSPPPHVVPALYRARRATIVGDVHQLEPVVTLPEREERAIRARMDAPVPDAHLEHVRVVGGGLASAQRLAERAFDPPRVLSDHYRCQAPIIDISGRLCGYRFRVHTPPRGLVERVPWLVGPVSLVSVQGRQQESGGSWVNPEEAARVVAMVRDLVFTRGVPAGRVAVLTPYRAQARLLWRELSALGVSLVAGHEQAAAVEMMLPGLEDHGEPLMLGTIHGLQGGERDVVILSTVATEARSLGWLNRRPNLVNVAVSRARLHLVTVGDPAALEGGRHTRELVTSVPPEALLR